MLGVVRVGQVAVHGAHLKGVEDQPFALQTRDYLADKAATHRIGLDQHERPLHDITP
jgi:hypothetical protein